MAEIKIINWMIIPIILIKVVMNVRIPDNPCPDLFHYQISPEGVRFGQLGIPYDGSRILDLGVNVSLVGYYKNLKLKLDMLTPQEDILSQNVVNYRVNFPFQDILPKLTRVTFNGRTFCAGAPEPLGTQGVTNLWSGLLFRIHTYTYTIKNGAVISEPTHAHHYPSIASDSNNIKNPVSPTENDINIIPPNNPNLSKNPFLNQATKIVTTSTTNKPSIAPTIQKRYNQDSCGVANDIQSLVVNGDKTTENEYPWLVALFYRQGISYQFQCTANLVSKNHVLTAAHCVQFHKAPLVDREDMLLILGQSNLTHWASSGATIRTVSEVYVHPEYKQFSGHCDVAVIKLNEPVTFKQSIRPICLWEGDDNLRHLINEKGVVTGWGKDETERQSVPELRKVNMPIVSQENCLRSNQGFLNLTSDMTFCAGNRDGSGPCTGDSGAGFMVKRNNKWSLRGLVSTAIKNAENYSCNLREYVVFSDIAKLLDWVRSCLSK